MTTLNETPTNTAAKAGVWTGLVVGADVKHRGAHAAVLGEDGTPLCLCGPATDKQSRADARLFAHLWNEARKANVSIAALN